MWGVRVRNLLEVASLSPGSLSSGGSGLRAAQALAILLSPPLPSLQQALLHPSIWHLTLSFDLQGVWICRLAFKWGTRAILLIDVQYFICNNGHAQTWYTSAMTAMPRCGTPAMMAMLRCDALAIMPTQNPFPSHPLLDLSFLCSGMTGSLSVS